MSKTRPRTWAIGLGFLLIGTLGAFVLGHLAAGFLFLPAKLARPEVRHAPQLAGASLEEARERADGAGTDLDVLGLAYSTDVDSGEVLFQYPPHRLPLEQRKPLEVLVSAGRGARRVPDLTGLSQESALRVLVTAGIPLAAVRMVADEAFERGAVVSTDPPPGTAVGKGDSIVVAVSQGGAVVEVPSLVGKGLKEAGEVLQGAQLQVGQTTFAEGEDEESPGDLTVVGQDPPAGGLARSGSEVDLRLGKARAGSGASE